MSKGKHGKPVSWNDIDESTSMDIANNTEMFKERGVKTTNVDIDDNDLCFFADYPHSKSLSASHTIGKVVLDNDMHMDELVKVLCDTGALSANYIASDLIKRLQSKLSNEHFFKTKCKVTLADSKTTKNINTGVRLKLVLQDHKAHTYAYTGDIFVIDMKKNDIIVGLPALTGRLHGFMQALMDKAHVDQAFGMACSDQDQHVVAKILHHTGDPMVRTTLTFSVLFAAGDTRELPYSKDLFDSIPYEEYCDSKPYLRHLKYPTEQAKKFIQDIKRKPIQGFQEKQEVYVDIRLYGDGWFNKLELPDTQTMMYVSKFQILKCYTKKLQMMNVITNDTHLLTAYQIYCYVHTTFDPASMVLIDEAFMLEYPQVTQD